MFKISCLCKDEQVASVLRVLSQHETFNVEALPVTNANPTASRAPAQRRAPRDRKPHPWKGQGRAEKIIIGMLNRAGLDGVRPSDMTHAMIRNGLTGSAHYHPLQKFKQEGRVRKNEDGRYLWVKQPEEDAPGQQPAEMEAVS